MGSFGTDEGFSLKIERFRQLAAGFVANKRSQRTQAAKPAPAAPPAQTRKPVRYSLEPTEIEIPAVADFVDPEDFAAKIVRSGQMARGKLPIPTPAPSGLAAEILRAGNLARSGGPQRELPTGTAAAIIAAGEKRRKPRGG
jgi:hypothetical protein